MTWSLCALRPRLFTALVTSLSLASCVDAPSAPDAANFAPPFVIAPSLALVGPGGAPVASDAQADALNEAFDTVDRFRMVVTRLSTGLTVVDTTITVQPGADQYDLSVSIDITTAEERFSIVLTAFHGSTELFTSEPVTVQATPVSQSSPTSPPAATSVTMQYSGPGTTATSVQIAPATLVLGPGGSGSFSAEVQGSDGTIANVPLSWSLSSTGVVDVNAGAVSALGEGAVQVAVTTPTGLEAKAWAYVLGGQLAYAQGGVIQVRGAAGGDATSLSSVGDAAQPAWSPDGTRLFYVAGGNVHLAGGSALVEGSWPSISPDGAKIAVDRGGTVYFANADGTHPTAGPRGSTPVWADGESVLVAGGSVEQVRADGSVRTPLAGGAASLPARSPSGAVAYVADGQLFVAGQSGAILDGVQGRPSWSPDEMWIVVAAGAGLTVVPSDGRGPGALLPGLSDATDPAFKTDSPLVPTAEVTIARLDPDPPIPGESVTVHGSGFDWIIPANNAVYWPTPLGAQASEIRAVTASTLLTTMPRSVAEGQIRVETGGSSGLLAFDPQLAAINVVAATSFGDPVSGVTVVVRDGDGTGVADGTTDGEGSLLLAGLQPGSYRVEFAAPRGFRIEDEPVREVTLATETVLLEVAVLPLVESVRTIPEALEVEVGASLEVTLVPLDVDGKALERVSTSRWLGGLPSVAAVGEGLKGTIIGLTPSAGAGPQASLMTVQLNGKVLEISVSVTSHVEGTVVKDPAPATVEGEGNQGPETVAATPEPSPGTTVKVTLDGKEVSSAVTDLLGHYRATGLFAGVYEVTIDPTPTHTPVPEVHEVTLDDGQPTAVADFLLSRASVDHIVLSTDPVEIDALEGTVQIHVGAYDADENALSNRPTTFTSLHPDIAVVDATGVVTGVDNGVATIEVTVEAVTSTIDVTVDQKAVVITILDDKTSEPMPDDLSAVVGDEGWVNWEAFDVNGHPIKHKGPAYASTDPLVASVDAAGLVSTLMVGTTDISVEMDGATDVLTLHILGATAGDLVISDVPGPGVMTPAEVAAAQLGRVNGSLLIQSTGLTSLAGLEGLLEVTGDVVVQYNGSLATLEGLGGIRWVSGDFVIEGNPQLLTPAAPTPAILEAVEGSFVLWDNAQITNADFFANLQHVGWEVVVGDNLALQNLDGLSSLHHIPETLYLYNNPALNSLGNLPAVVDIGGDLIIEAGARIFGMPMLDAVGGVVSVGGEGAYNNTVIEGLHLPALTCTGQGVEIMDNQALTTVDLPSLEFVNGDCVVAPPAPVALRTERTPDQPEFALWREPPEGRRPGQARPAERWTRRVEAVRESAAESLAALRAQSDEVKASARAARQQEAKSTWEEVAEVRRRTVARRNAQEEADVRDDPTEPLGAPSILQPGPRREQDPPSLLSEGPISRWTTTAEATTTRLSPQQAFASWSPVIVSHNPALSALGLPSLRELSGDFEVSDLGLTSLTLPALWDVGDAFSVNRMPSLESLSVPELVNVGGTFELWDNPVLTSPLFPHLVDIGADVYVGSGGSTYPGGGAMGTVSFPQLQHVDFYLDFMNNDGLTSISIPLLAQVLNDVYIGGNAGLVDVEIATGSLLDVQSDFIIDKNPDLETVNVPGLSYVGWWLDVNENNGLTSVSLATAAQLTVGGDIWVNINEVPHPWTLTIPGLVDVGGEIFVNANPGLQSVTMASGDPATAAAFHLSFNPDLQTASFPNLQSLSDSFWTQYLPGLQTLSCPALQSVGTDLTLQEMGTAGTPVTLAFDALASVGNRAYIQYNPGLESFAFPSLTHVAPPVAPALAGPQAYPGVAPGGRLYVIGNETLTAFDLSALNVVANVYVDENAALVNLGALSSLQPGAWFSARHNPLLENVDGLAGLTDLNTFRLDDNPSVSDWSGLADLETVVWFQIWSGGGSGTLSLPALTHVWHNFEILNNPDLAGVSAPALTHVGDGFSGNLYLNNNLSLTSADLSSLATLDGQLQVTNTALTALNMALTSPVYSVMVLYNAALTSVSGLAGIGTTDANPAVASSFMIGSNSSLSDCHVKTDVVDVIEARNPGSAFGVTPSIGNVPCVSKD